MMFNLLANSFTGPDPLRPDLTQTKSRSQSSLTSSINGEPHLNGRPPLPLGVGHQVRRKSMPRRKPTINHSQRGLVNIPELFVQTGAASLDGPLPMLVRAESHSQKPEDINEESWQESEIPEELGHVNGEEPEEIRNIIQESLDEHRALRASKLHTQAIVVRTTITMSSSGSDENIVSPAVETSATTSIRSRSFDLNRSPDRPSSSDRASPDSLALASTKSGGSVYFDTALNNLRSSTEIVPTSSQESLSLSSSSRARPTQETQQDEPIAKPPRNHMLFKILGRRPKGFKLPNDPPEEIKECTSCFDDIPDLKSVSLPCRHPYCAPCFSKLVSTAIQSEDTFPPKCCLQEIPRRIIDTALSSQEMTEYDQKALEYTVDVGSRYYCGSPECAKWIDTRKAARLNGALECPHCKFWMCTSCRGAQHRANQDCPQDFGLSAALEQAERAGWRRCYNCRTMVELNTGCRHITCKCRAEFCYTCGLRWRTCGCTEADQTRRENEIAERLARFNAELRAEEAEVREAIAAVERAERQVAAEREAEERANEAARLAEEQEELARVEYARVEGINSYFDYLRGRLQKVTEQQRQRIATRHSSELPKLEQMASDVSKANIATERSRIITKERMAIQASQEEKISALRRSHALEIGNTLQRHQDDQDAVFMQPIQGPETQRGFLTEGVLKLLSEAQELEHQTLQAQHEREIKKWQYREALELKEFDEIMREELSRFMKMHAARMEEVQKALRVARKQIAADWKWFDLLARVRSVMVDEDENRMIVSGADAPEILVAEEPVA